VQAQNPFAVRPREAAVSTIQAIINLLRLKQEVQKDNLTIEKTKLEIAEKQEQKSSRESGIVTSVSVDDIQTYDPRARRIKNLVAEDEALYNIGDRSDARMRSAKSSGPRLIHAIAVILFVALAFYIVGRYL
jgi:hypothetical protein